MTYNGGTATTHWLRKEYPVRIGELQKIDLSSFENRTVEISFSARQADAAELGGTLTWIDPVIDSVKHAGGRGQPDLRQFRERQKGRNVLLFVLDAAGAAHFSCYDYFRQTTPVIDSVAKDGILFENAVCPAPSTRPSTATLFSGLYPEVHGVLTFTKAFPQRLRTLPELFQAEGYATALFSGNPAGAMGYEQGFERVAAGPRSHKALLANSLISDADKLVPLVTSWLTEVQHQPFFGYVHFREPHAPYKPPGEFASLFLGEKKVGNRNTMVALYDGNLSFVDNQLGRILDHLQRLGQLEHTILVVMADHGEAFWQHGDRGHMRQVYEEMIRIPLIFRFPGEPEWKGVRRTSVAGTIDILPTFIDLFSFSRKGVIQNGRSLLPLFAGQTSERLLLAVCEGDRPAYALRSTNFKYIQYQKRRFPDEFYHLERDPQEKNNVMLQFPVLSGFYRVELQRKLDELRHLGSQMNQLPRPQLVLDEQTKEELRALGYVY